MPEYSVSQPALLPMISMHITRLWLPADVYKRQGWDPRAKQSHTMALFAELRTAALFKSRAETKKNQYTNVLAACTPVSYTHLDVYKRQGQAIDLDVHLDGSDARAGAAHREVHIAVEVLHAPNAVSYTQLPARQTLYCAAAGTGAYHQPVRELAAARRGHCPVSYTHLDVYKRQNSRCSRCSKKPEP